jgi:hypothetical protein
MLESPQNSDTAETAWLPLAGRAAQLAARIRAALADPKGRER